MRGFRNSVSLNSDALVPGRLSSCRYLILLEEEREGPPVLFKPPAGYFGLAWLEVGCVQRLPHSDPREERSRRSVLGTVPAPPATRMTSQLENAMDALIAVFHSYSGKEGDKYKLSKKELKELLQNELGCFLETQRDTEAVDKIMHDLDENGDGEVDFQEFVVLV
ncbi:uncharacterized protein LOC103053214, partial [Python bivittatus]|uniref:Uncharacterized protein LOC103053214 n=1 Tax=Python bivittatus TaxID=176946 RepID=A0A9F2PNI1_PYTBI